MKSNTRRTAADFLRRRSDFAAKAADTLGRYADYLEAEEPEQEPG